MLLAAASQRMQVPASALGTEFGYVVDPATGARLGYGELADAAAGLPLPEDPQLKNEDEFYFKMDKGKRNQEGKFVEDEDSDSDFD